MFAPEASLISPVCPGLMGQGAHSGILAPGARAQSGGGAGWVKWPGCLRAFAARWDLSAHRAWPPFSFPRLPWESSQTKG